MRKGPSCPLGLAQAGARGGRWRAGAAPPGRRPAARRLGARCRPRASSVRTPLAVAFLGPASEPEVHILAPIAWPVSGPQHRRSDPLCPPALHGPQADAAVVGQLLLREQRLVGHMSILRRPGHLLLAHVTYSRGLSSNIE